MTENTVRLPIGISNLARISFAFYEGYLEQKYPGIKIYYFTECIELVFDNNMQLTLFALADAEKFK